MNAFKIKIRMKNGNEYSVDNICENDFRVFANKIVSKEGFLVFNDLLVNTSEIEAIEQIK
jgi:hypothetical protein